MAFEQPGERNPNLLAEIVSAGREQTQKGRAEYERDSHFRHKARMEQFRAWVYRQDHLDASEKAEMIKASFTW